MSLKKKLLMVLLVLLLLTSVVAGMLWHRDHYTMVDFRFYPKDARNLDLRGKSISVRHYEKLLRRMPGVDVIWDVPLSAGSYPSNVKEIAITGLESKDIEKMDYLTRLELVKADGCEDYPELLALQQHRPEIEVSYRIQLGQKMVSNTAREAEVKNPTAEQVALLQYLPMLESVVCTGGEEEALTALREYCTESGLRFGVVVKGQTLLENEKELRLVGASEEDVFLLHFLTGAESIHLVEPETDADSLLALRQALPETQVSWEKEIYGQNHSTEDTEIDLSEVAIHSLDKLEQSLAYFPDAKTVYLGKQEIDNDTLAKYRDQMREKYKVAWQVQLGEKLTARTDDTTFMPVRESVYYFKDNESYNLRYCEDMVCIDIGHMSISDISFVEFMPKLEYLILAHTQVQYIEPIRNCKNLKFLELDWSPVRDLAPLVDCTGLEDLNVGNTYARIDPVTEMTWLKNLWMIGCSQGNIYKAVQDLTDTRIMYSGDATVAGGWRELDNYYKMRDLLGMEYMPW